jgi:hypothetical protein
MAQAETTNNKAWLNKNRIRRPGAAGRHDVSSRLDRMRLSLLLRWVTSLKSFSMLRREKPEILGVDGFVNLCLTTKILSNTPRVKQAVHRGWICLGGGRLRHLPEAFFSKPS